MANVSLKKRLDFFLFGWIINLAYSEYYRPKYNYMPYYKLFFHYFIPQKVFRLNNESKWPVHFTSVIINAGNIEKGILCDPGDNSNIYIQAINGIKIGSNVGFGSGVKILSANHSHEDHSKHDKTSPIVIGNNVFVGANSVILPGVTIGDNVVIGAGSIVSKNISTNSIAVGNPAKIINTKSAYIEDFSQLKFNRDIPEKYHNFIKGIF